MQRSSHLQLQGNWPIKEIRWGRKPEGLWIIFLIPTRQNWSGLPHE